MNKPTKFYGHWIFQPQSAAYQLGKPPQQGSYAVQQDGDVLRFTMDWVDAEGKAFHQIYETQPDGKDHPYENPTIADTVTTTLVDADTLDTITKKGGTVLVTARRILTQDGQHMIVTMSGTMPDGSAYTNLSIYERDSIS